MNAPGCAGSRSNCSSHLSCAWRNAVIKGAPTDRRRGIKGAPSYKLLHLKRINTDNEDTCHNNCSGYTRDLFRISAESAVILAWVRWFFSVPPDKGWGSTSTKPRPFPSKSFHFVIHQCLILADKKFFPATKLPDGLRGPPTFYSIGTGGFFHGVKWSGYEVNHHLHLLPRLGMSRDKLLLLLYTFCFWRGQGQL